MAQKKEFCINHPEKKTARKCYYCQAPICIDCRKTYFHHFFCSERHAYLWKAREIFRTIKPSRDMIWLLGIIILSNIIMYQFLKPDQSSSIKKSAVAMHDTAQSNMYALDTLRHFSQKEMTVSVAALPGQAVILQNNGIAVDTRVGGRDKVIFSDIRLHNGLNHLAVWVVNDKGQSTLADSFSVTLSNRRSRILARPVYSVAKRKGLVALTFDGGSSDRGTRHILDILRRAGLHCTMFLTGRFVEHFPHLVEQILSDGHEIGNHTYTHPHLTNLEKDGSNHKRAYVNSRYMYRQLNGTDSIFFKRFNQHMKPYWRAPFGEINPEILKWAADLGFRHIGWSAHCDSWDWVADTTSKLYRSPQEIEAHFLEVEAEKGLSGKIILMHLGSERKKDFPYETLTDLIQRLQKRGYRFVKISALLQPVTI